ncbi:flagellar biosynthesis protein FliO [Acidovorax sp. SRB_14]|uniref:FliO/MopB family protein n=1 Tax=Acidovorax sp. SRB_14 TaxID=1962699 RepID=UPI00156411C1|nr:flagellar biosynthetic protein FliO [Acidovorax sp. SRB_14]NMM82254.1 flagellar biosynthesis protein FliO [Acidovorax sp. SRB_14]
MAQTLGLVVLFVAAMAALPWLIRRVQQRQAQGAGSAGTAARVLSAVAVGPHQRVVTVEVGPENARTCLVLGVTAQQVSCLHVLAVPTAPAVVSAPSFAKEMAAASGPTTPAAASHE